MAAGDGKKVSSMAAKGDGSMKKTSGKGVNVKRNNGA